MLTKVVPRSTAFAGAIVLAASLSACGHGTPSTAEGSTPPITNSRDPSTWVSGPGFIGPIKAGMTAQELVRLGLVQRTDNSSCDFKWVEGPQALVAAGVNVEFRVGNPDDVDTVMAGYNFNENHLGFKTVEGIGVGTSVAALRAAYRDLHYGEWQGEGAKLAGWYRTTSAGSIYFNVGKSRVAAGGQTYAGDGTEVNEIQVTAATDPAKFAPDGGGC